MPWTPENIETLLETRAVSKSDVIAFLQRHAQPVWLQLWQLQGPRRALSSNRNARQVVAAYRDFVLSGEHAVACIEDAMDVVPDEADKVSVSVRWERVWMG